MSFSSGETGIERGATKFLFSKAPKVVSRYAEGGVERVVAVSVPGTPIVCEYAAVQDRRQLVLRCEAVTASEMADLLTILDDTGPVEVKWVAAGTVSYPAAFGERNEHQLEPVFGHYPEAAPSALTYWRVQLTLYLLEE